MKNLKILIVLIAIGSSNTSCSQKINEAGLKSRNAAISAVEKLFSNKLANKNYVVFSVSDEKFIITVEEENSYKEYYYNSSDKVSELKVVSYKKPNELMREIFDKSNYKEEFVTFNSKFFKPEYKASSGNITYFVYNSKNGNRYGEARLSMIIKPNPIPTNIYLHFVKRILFYANKG